MNKCSDDDNTSNFNVKLKEIKAAAAGQQRGSEQDYKNVMEHNAKH